MAEEEESLTSHPFRTGGEHLHAPATYSLDTLHRTHRRLLLSDLEVDKIQHQSYVALQVIDPDPQKFISVLFDVEDETGRKVKLSLSNFLSPTRFRGKRDGSGLPKQDVQWALFPHQKLVLLEPLLKVSNDGHATLRCDNPTHIIWLEDDSDPHGLLGQLVHRLHPELIPSRPGAEAFKAVGNEYFKKDMFSKAASSYTKGVLIVGKTSAQSPSAQKQLYVTLVSNRSEAMLRLGHHRFALRDADWALAVDPAHCKSISRKARAQTELNLFSEALSTTEQGLKLEAASGVFRGLRRDLTRRLRSPRRAADIDFAGMLRASMRQERGEAKLLWPDFTGPIKAKESGSGHGRGMFATEDLLAGQVVLVEKAAAVVFSSELPEVGANTGAELIWKLTEICRSSPETHAAIKELSRGCDGIEEVTGPSQVTELLDEDETKTIHANTDLCVAVDVKEIKAVLGVFAMSRRNVQGIRPRLLPDTIAPTNIHGVWHRMGLFGNSCLPNCCLIVIGDMVVISAWKPVRHGEELTLCYCNPLSSYEERQAQFRLFGFSCECERCVLEKYLQHQLSALDKRVKGTISRLLPRSELPAETAFSMLSDLAKDISMLKPAGLDLLMKTTCTNIELLGTIASPRRLRIHGLEIKSEHLEAYFKDGHCLLPEFTVPSQCIQVAKMYNARRNEAKMEEYRQRAKRIAHDFLGSSDALISYMYGES